MKEPRISALSLVAINCLLPVSQTMWCGSGNHVYVVDMDSEFLEVRIVIVFSVCLSVCITILCPM